MDALIAALAVMFDASSASVDGSSGGGELAEAARRRSAAEAFGSYEVHLAACNRKFNKSGFQRSWDFGLKPTVTSFAGVVCARGPFLVRSARSTIVKLRLAPSNFRATPLSVVVFGPRLYTQQSAPL